MVKLPRTTAEFQLYPQLASKLGRKGGKADRSAKEPKERHKPPRKPKPPAK